MKDLIEFFTKRKKGAQEIAESARAKGGPAILTAWHFAAKNKPYFEAIQAIKAKKKLSFFKEKYNYFKSMLNTDNEKSFQEVTGALEVFGEVLTKLKEENYGI